MSAANAKTALGTKFYMAPDGSTVVLVGEVLQFDPIKITRGVIDASDLATTGGAEYIAQALYDGGQLSGQMHYIAGSTDDDAFLLAVTTGALQDVKIVVKAASGTEDITCSGYITEYGGNTMEISGKQTSSFTLKVSGDVAQAASV